MTSHEPSYHGNQRGFEPQHWGVSEMRLLDPDRRPISVQGPLPQWRRRLECHG